MEKNLLNGKKILIVDDEPDVIDTLEEYLEMADVVRASNFTEAQELLTTQHFDFAILDIMGVDGYRLLEIARERKIIALMLTAHALSPKETLKSFKKGAASFVPKEKMENIVLYLNDLMEAQKKGRNFWWRWFDRFGDFYDKKFGAEWQEENKDSWESLKYSDRL